MPTQCRCRRPSYPHGQARCRRKTPRPYSGKRDDLRVRQKLPPHLAPRIRAKTNISPHCSAPHRLVLRAPSCGMEYRPERTTLTLPLTKTSAEKVSTEKIGSFRSEGPDDELRLVPPYPSTRHAATTVTTPTSSFTRTRHRRAHRGVKPQTSKEPTSSYQKRQERLVQ